MLEPLCICCWIILVFCLPHSASASCGTSLSLPEPRIIGGRTVLFGQIPWQVSIQAYGVNFCGGAILNDRWILTAAHCTKAVERNQLTIVLGTVELNRFDSFLHASPEQKFGVDLIIVHDKFNRTQLVNDIALLRLTKKINFNGQAQPVCLPEAEENFVGKMGVVSGWGKQSESDYEPSRKMNFVELPVVTNAFCQQAYRSQKPPRRVRIRDSWICAGFPEGGRDACQGDSGGPMAVNVDGVWKIAGITSGGFKCARPNSPGLFTRVSVYLPWINQQIAANP